MFSKFSIFFPNLSIFFQFWFFFNFFLFFVLSLLFHSILSLFTGIVFILKFILQNFHKLQFQLLGSNSGHLGACHRSEPLSQIHMMKSKGNASGQFSVKTPNFRLKVHPVPIKNEKTLANLVDF
jgi:hypothetical protein